MARFAPTLAGRPRVTAGATNDQAIPFSFVYAAPRPIDQSMQTRTWRVMRARFIFRDGRTFGRP